MGLLAYEKQRDAPLTKGRSTPLMQQSAFVQMGAGVAVDGLAHFCSTAFEGNKARVSSI
jgi:hypothetical protein